MHPNIVSEAVPVKLGPHFQGHMKTQSFTPKNLHLGAQSWYFSPCPSTGAFAKPCVIQL